MTVLKLEEIAQKHPLLRTQNISGTLSYWYQNVNTYLLANRLPLVYEDRDKIQVDVSKQSRGGMTPMVHMGAESPIYDPKYGRGRREFEAATFREKVRLGPEDLYDLREIGTEGDLERARVLMDSRTNDLQYRLANRAEWLRRQVLFEGKVTAELEDGTPYEIKYAHPGYLQPQAATSFDDYANSDPVAALQDVIDAYEVDTGRMVDEIILPYGMLRHFMMNQKFRDLSSNNLAVFRGTKVETERLMLDLLGVGSLTVSRDFIHFQTDLAVDAPEGATSMTLDSVEGLEVGDTIYIVSAADQDREKFTIASITGKTVTFAGAEAVARKGGYLAGDPIKHKTPIIPSSKILMFGKFEGALSEEGELHPEKIADPNRWGEVVSTRSIYADLENPRPGMYSRVIDMTEGDPPYLEYILGIRMLPRIINNEAWLVLDAIH